MSDVRNLAINKAMSPDGISYELLREFAPIFFFHICHIYNQLLRKGFVPDPLKQSIVTPPPRPQDITSELVAIYLRQGQESMRRFV